MQINILKTQQVRDSRYKNRPPHQLHQNKYYFITSRTINKEKHFSGDKKQFIKQVLEEAAREDKIKLFAWVVLDNHYHLLGKLSDIEKLPLVIRFIHGKSAILLNKFDNKSGRKIWHNYWDYCIRNEIDFWKHFNYIHNNPVKHQYVKSLEELGKYQFSSYNKWLEKKGKSWLMDCFRSYPIIDYSDDE